MSSASVPSPGVRMKENVIVLLLLGLFVTGYLLLPSFYQGNKPLYKAIERGDREEVRRLLDSGANPDSMSKELVGFSDSPDYPDPPLIIAIQKNHVEIVRLLLDRNVSPNTRDGSGHTALIVAASSSNMDMTKLLLDRGADTQAVSKRDGGTVLDYQELILGELCKVPRPLKPEIYALLKKAGAH